MSPSRTSRFWVSFESSFSPTKEPPRTTPEGKQKEHILARKTSTRALEVSSSKTRLRESSQNARARARISVFFSPFFCSQTASSPLSLCPHTRERKNVEGEGSTAKKERRDVRKRRANARTRRSISFPLVSTLPLHLPNTRIFSSTP